MGDRILNLLEQIKILEFELDNLIYGSIEVRDSRDNKYIYCHSRENGVQTTKYIGEYTDVLFNVINENNLVAKELKKKLRKFQKELVLFRYGKYYRRWSS